MLYLFGQHHGVDQSGRSVLSFGRAFNLRLCFDVSLTGLISARRLCSGNSTGDPTGDTDLARYKHTRKSTARTSSIRR
jgi:hypothetical protein